jgi:hypothetical protein
LATTSDPSLTTTTTIPTTPTFTTTTESWTFRGHAVYTEVTHPISTPTTTTTTTTTTSDQNDDESIRTASSSSSLSESKVGPSETNYDSTHTWIWMFLHILESYETGIGPTRIYRSLFGFVRTGQISQTRTTTGYRVFDTPMGGLD